MAALLLVITPFQASLSLSLSLSHGFNPTEGQLVKGHAVAAAGRKGEAGSVSTLVA